MNPRPLRELTGLEARVLGVLIEKERSVPDSYPLTLNALAAGCNQKTSRNPVIVASDAEILAAIDALKALSLVIESSGGRVMRYAQNFKRVLQVPTESVALLAALILRGPQTAAELRTNSDRLCRISDISAVEAFLQELAARATGALVVELPRQPGSREYRWMHRLCGDAGLPAPPATITDDSAMAVDLPLVVAEVTALLARYASALADSDLETLAGLAWQSPRAVRDGASKNLRDSDEIGVAGDGRTAADPAPTILRTCVTTFGRDCAVTRVEFSRADSPEVDRRGQTWVRLPQGWRVVAQG